MAAFAPASYCYYEDTEEPSNVYLFSASLLLTISFLFLKKHELRRS